MGLVEVSGRMVSEKKDPLLRETIFGSYRIILSGRRDQQGRCDSSHLAQRPRSAGVLGYHVKELVMSKVERTRADVNSWCEEHILE